MMLFCLLIATVPLLFLGVFSYYLASKSIEEKVQKGNLQTLTQIHSRVEQVLKNVDNSLTQYVNSSLAKKAMNMSLTASDFQMIQQMLTDLYYFQTFELGVQNVAIVHFDYQWILTEGGMYHFNEATLSESIMRYKEASWHSAWVTEAFYDSYIESSSLSDENRKNYYSVNLVKKVPINSPKPTGLAIARIPSYELVKNLENSELGEFMIVDSHNHILAHRDMRLIGQPVSDLHPVLDTENRSETSGYYESSGLGITYQKSEYSGWTYVSLVSLKEITSDSRKIGWLTTIFTACSILLICFITYQGSRRMYNPIRQLYHFAIHSSSSNHDREMDEIESIGKSIQSMLQNQNKARVQLQQQIPRILYLYMLRLYRGEMSEVEFTERKAELGVDPDQWSSYYVLAVQIQTLENSRYRQKDKDILMFAVDNMICELIPSSNRLLPVIMDDMLIVMFGITDKVEGDTKELLNPYVKSIQKSVEYYLELTVNCGISRSYDRIVHASRAYQEATAALKFSNMKGYSAAFYYEEVYPSVQSCTYPTEAEEMLIDAVRSSDEVQSRRLLRELLEALVKQQTSLQDYEYALMRLLVSLNRVIQDNNGSGIAWSAQELSLFRQLMELENIDEIEAWFAGNVLLPILERLRADQENHYKQMTDRVIELIHTRYNQDITLMMCAEELNYHPHYIGKVFRSCTGKTFSEYLHNYRMELARQWLKESDKKIHEIAVDLGFYNAQNFIRSFRKTEGMTPGAYREQSNSS